MNIEVHMQIDLTGLTDAQVEAVRVSNEHMQPHEHAPDCPVRHGASLDCVWPHAVCYVYAVGGTPYRVTVK